MSERPRYAMERCDGYGDGNSLYEITDNGDGSTTPRTLASRVRYVDAVTIVHALNNYNDFAGHVPGCDP